MTRPYPYGDFIWMNTALHPICGGSCGRRCGNAVDEEAAAVDLPVHGNILRDLPDSVDCVFVSGKESMRAL